MLAALPAVTGCAADAAAGDAEPLEVTLRVVDESARPIAGATVDVAGERTTTDAGGLAALVAPEGPAVAVVSASGHLVEPVPFGWDDAGQTMTVELLGDRGGKRIVIHSAGDVMFGRRYEQPPDGAALVPRRGAGDGASDVVSRVAPLFAAADLRTINLETVVTERPDGDAYPGKRFILRTRPGALAGVRALGADIAVLANNHQRDFLDPGIADTLRELDRARITWLGASAGGAAPRDAVVRDVHGTRVAVLAWTTVDGGFVNDSYPSDDAAVPPDVSSADAWQYAPRRWGYTGPALDVPEAERRIGSAWQLFDAAEQSMADPDSASAWSSVSRIYPELQDWVARRGHGGAAQWRNSEASARIAELRADADLVIVQIHGGFQFQEAASSNVRTIARRAIDAGADLVVCHHPHVLQGIEWYRGKLIAYSLGNFVFDQDFLSTFASVVLRTVWDGNQLVQARLLPIELVGYRPTPVVDRAARRTLLGLWERSLVRAASDRIDGGVRAQPIELDADTALPGFALERHTARLVPSLPTPTGLTLSIPARGVAPLPDGAVFDPHLRGAAAVWIGRDLLGWGRFDDPLADAESARDPHWHDVGHDYRRIDTDGPGGGFLHLERRASSQVSVLARPVARIPLGRHRLFQGDQPVDPVADYSVRLRARATGSAAARVRLDLYQFDDANPTEDPESTLIASLELPLAATRKWSELELPVPAARLGNANMAMLYLVLDPPADGRASLDVDDIAVIEWRPAAADSGRFGRYELVRNRSDRAVRATIDHVRFAR